MTKEQFSIPLTILRGGTSRGIYLLESDLPEDRSLWGPYLIELFGSRSGRQIDGLGGADPTTSKCCIIGPNPDPEIDVTYTFAQVGIGEERVYWDMNCGNLISSVGTFAILAGLVEPQEGITRVRVFQTNTQRLIGVEVPVKDGEPVVDGDLEIGGVPGSGAPVGIDFAQTVGASLGGSLFPSGNRRDTIEVPGHGPLEVSIVDLGNMCVFFRATDLGFTGIEGTERGVDLAPVFHRVREACRELLGLEPGGSTPWPVSIAPRQEYPSSLGDKIVEADSHDFVARFSGIPSMRDTIHQAFPGTGASCLSVAAVTPGTIVNEFYAVSDAPTHREGVVNFGHPTGVMTIEAGVEDAADPADVVVKRATSTRTVRLLLEGKAYLRHSEIARLERELPADGHTRAAVPAPIPSGVAAG
jgi:2-methylaconitate cis-trans-isomerase PrpF